QLCRRAGFRPKFVQKAASVSNMFTLIGSENAVTLVPAYLKSFPVAGVAMVPLSDTKATWDFLVVWQRGRTAKSVRALLDALAVSANSFELRMATNNGSGLDRVAGWPPNQPSYGARTEADFFLRNGLFQTLIACDTLAFDRREVTIEAALQLANRWRRRLSHRSIDLLLPGTQSQAPDFQ